MQTNEKSAAARRLVIYLLLTFAVSWLYEFLVVIPTVTKNPSGGAAMLVTGAVMLVPALCSLLTRLITKEGFSGMWLRPHLKKSWKYYLAALLAPTALTIIGAAVYFLVTPGSFDPSLPVFAAALAQAGAPVGEGMLWPMIIIQVAQAALLAPFINLVFALGEELGWRGYMLQKLRASGLKILPALLIGGLIWGVWHAPLTWGIGHNYGMGYPGYPWTGIAMMCGFCVANGALLSWVTLKSRSCLSAGLMHGALNAIAGLGIYFVSSEAYYDPFTGPAPTGWIGGCAFIAAAVAVTVLMVRDERAGRLENEPQLPAEPDAGAAVPASALPSGGFTRDSVRLPQSPESPDSDS